MALRIIGDDLFARDSSGRLRSRIATVFPRTQTIVTLPGIHASQRLAYVDLINEQRAAVGKPPLTEDEELEEWMASVDLVVDENAVLIRPDAENMPLAFEADEVLQQAVSIRKIKFLYVLEPRVRDAIKRRGERWRMSPLPRSKEEMRRMIAESRIGIGGREIYYYNKTTGSRILTYQEFAGLEKMNDDELRSHLEEIGRHCEQCNRIGSPEVEFFAADGPAIKAVLDKKEFYDPSPSRLRDNYLSLRNIFRDSTPPQFQRDDLLSPEWRSRMFAALIGHTDQEVSEESLLGLGAEFFMQIEWLPGARIEDGELLLDPVFEEESQQNIPASQRITDEPARGFIFNFIRDHGDLQYVNIGRVGGSLSSRTPSPGRRGVYLAEVKRRDLSEPILRIIRMQKHDVREHLDEGHDLLSAITDSEEYTEYILDRRLGCRQLGMNLSHRTVARKVREKYTGRNNKYSGIALFSTYFEREFLSGQATDKIASWRFGETNYALHFARAMGRAAAPNLIVGRCDTHGATIFDDGDELIIEDANGLPNYIIVADHTGTFGEYRRPLTDLAPGYAGPLRKRAAWLADPAAFGEAYLTAFVIRFTQIQQEYHKRKRAFDTLFKHLKRDEGGSFLFRWECVLQRLERTDPIKLAERIREGFKLEASTPISSLGVQAAPRS